MKAKPDPKKISNIPPAEQTALLGNDVKGWIHVCEMRGDMIPDDFETQEDMFHQRRMVADIVPMPEREASRERLHNKGVIKKEDHPLRPIEKLTKKKAKIHAGTDIKKMVNEGGQIEEYVLIFETPNARNTEFFKAQNVLGKDLDLVRSSVWNMELHLLPKQAKGNQKAEPAKRIKFLLATEHWEPEENKEYMFKTVFNV